MNLIDFLCENDARVNYKDKWLVVGYKTVAGVGDVYTFTVYQKLNRKTIIIYNGDSEREAIESMDK